MKTKDFALQVAGKIFGVVAVLHLLRLLTAATVVINDWFLPVWINVLGFIATAFLSAVLWWLSLKKANK